MMLTEEDVEGIGRIVSGTSGLSKVIGAFGYTLDADRHLGASKERIPPSRSVPGWARSDAPYVRATWLVRCMVMPSDTDTQAMRFTLPITDPKHSEVFEAQIVLPHFLGEVEAFGVLFRPGFLARLGQPGRVFGREDRANREMLRRIFKEQLTLALNDYFHPYIPYKDFPTRVYSGLLAPRPDPYFMPLRVGLETATKSIFALYDWWCMQQIRATVEPSNKSERVLYAYREVSRPEGHVSFSWGSGSDDTSRATHVEYRGRLWGSAQSLDVQAPIYEIKGGLNLFRLPDLDEKRHHLASLFWAFGWEIEDDTSTPDRCSLARELLSTWPRNEIHEAKDLVPLLSTKRWPDDKALADYILAHCPNDEDLREHVLSLEGFKLLRP